MQVVNAVKYLAKESKLVKKNLLCFIDRMNIWFTVTSVTLILLLAEQQRVKMMDGWMAGQNMTIEVVISDS